MLSAVELDLAELLKNVNMNCEAGVLVICSVSALVCSGAVHLRQQDKVSVEVQ